jgi:hypothetical protein
MDGCLATVAGIDARQEALHQPSFGMRGQAVKAKGTLAHRDGGCGQLRGGEFYSLQGLDHDVSVLRLFDREQLGTGAEVGGESFDDERKRRGIRRSVENDAVVPVVTHGELRVGAGGCYLGIGWPLPVWRPALAVGRTIYMLIRSLEGFLLFGHERKVGWIFFFFFFFFQKNNPPW